MKYLALAALLLAPASLGQAGLFEDLSASTLVARTVGNATFDPSTGVLLHSPDDPHFGDHETREWHSVSLGLMLEGRDAGVSSNSNAGGLQRRKAPVAGSSGERRTRDLARQEVEFGLTERGNLVWPEGWKHLEQRTESTAKDVRIAKRATKKKSTKSSKAKAKLAAKKKKAAAAKKAAAHKKALAKAKAAKKKAAAAKKSKAAAAKKAASKKAASKKKASSAVAKKVKKVIAQVKYTAKAAAKPVTVMLASSIPTFKSVITWYNKDGLEDPYCAQKSGWTPTDNSMIAAVTEQWGDRPACGSYLQLTAPGTGKSIVVRVVDLCGGCAPGVPHVDLSVSAFQALYALDVGLVSNIVVATLAGSPVPTNSWTSALTTLYGPVDL